MRFTNLVLEGLRNPGQALAVILHLPKFIRLFVRLFRDPRVPWPLKGVFALALLYLVSPADLVPDFLLPGIGQLDDAIVLLVALQFFLRHAPQDVIAEHVREIDRGG